ncbi:FYDLN acid domain-containing protein [Anaeromyxobacter paludicola]|uniref:TIGR02300 family protein n=1 Tax=Anaeromyxobacter paludicola TaxID=2918171 RepID=A0ABM7X9D7_9BACT|nr:FYDLN acid domain-containing protein [Anaeromyxobacter paludicola]BDG08464.1 hypothetical protein AMPC_15770 [Anaeromyxobacter paludicola]
MPGKDLGTKHTCFKCGAKFYDLKKPEPICPKCGADQREQPVAKPASERRRAPARPPVEEPVATDELVEEGDLEDLDDEEPVEESDDE